MVRYFAKHPNAANLLMIIIFILGIVATLEMTRETLPEFSEDQIEVKIIYPGSTAREVEKTISTVVEEALEGLEGVEKIISKSSEGVSQVTIDMKMGYDIDTLYQDIKNEVDQITNFPDDAEEAIIYKKKKQSLVISVTLAGDIHFRDLKEYGKLLRKQLLAIDGVSLVVLKGVSQIQLKIKLKKHTLRAMGLNLNQIRDIIVSQSKDLPAGSIESKDQELLIRMMDQKYSPEDFNKLTLFSDKTGTIVKLSDVATITWELEKKENCSYFNGKRAVVLNVNKSSGEDALIIKKKVVTFVEKFKKTVPKGIKIRCVQDVAKIVQDRLNLLIKNGVQGLILVFITLCLFLNLKVAFWVAMGIPFSFMGALWLMKLWGLTLNMITMVSLILGIGLIVDDAIVLGENIYVHLRKGKNSLQACVDGTMEVSAGVICSFLTTIAAFMPLLFMEGRMGKVLRVMPIGVILGLGMSLIEAFLILPNHLTHSFENNEKRKPSKIRQKLESIIDYFIENQVSKTIKFCINNRYFSLTSVLAIFTLSIGLLAGGRVGFIPFPELDGDVMECNILLPSGTPFSKTKIITQKIEKAIWEVNKKYTPMQPGKKQLVISVNSIYGTNKDLKENGAHCAVVIVELLTSEKRNMTCDAIIEAWRKQVGNLADTVALKFAQMAIGPAGKAFDIQIIGKNLENLSKASSALKAKLATYDGVYNISDNLNPGKWELHISTLPLAKTLGLSSRDILNQLNSSFFGGKVQEFALGDENIEVRVQLVDEDRNSLTDIETFHLIDQKGNKIPLLNVVNIKIKRGYNSIHHIKGKRSVSVMADIDTRKGNAAKILAEMRAHFFHKFQNTFGVKIDMEGQAKETAKTGKSVQKGLLFGLVAIFIILAFVFGSYIQPLTVMVAIPMGFAGSVFGHYFMGINMSMPSVVGVVSLCGIVVNDSIVLMEFMNANLEKGMDIIKAAHLASVARFRAVFLTSMTTIAGLTPLIMEKSLQAQILIPLAVSIAFGLLFSTVLVLLFIPSLVGIFHDFGLLKEGKKK